jgi:hypothetical protein
MYIWKRSEMPVEMCICIISNGLLLGQYLPLLRDFGSCMVIFVNVCIRPITVAMEMRSFSVKRYGVYGIIL